MMNNALKTMLVGAAFSLVFVSPAAAQTALTATATVNVRTGPGTNHSVIDTVREGHGAVGIEKTASGWWKIWFDGRTAYTYAAYWNKAGGAYGMKIVKDSLNVRAGAGFDHAIKGRVYRGQVYRLIAVSGVWHKVWFGGGTGWLWGGGLTKVALSGGATEPSQPKDPPPPAASKLVELNRRPNWWYLQETNYWCGPATVKMVVKYVTGRVLSQGSLAREMGTSSNGGTRISESRAALRKYTRQDYDYDRFSRKTVKSNIDRNHPVAAAFDCRYIRYAVNRDGRHSTARHISPISGYTPNGILIYDSMWGDRKDKMAPLVKMPARYATDTEMINACRYFGSAALLARYRP